jgi:hypothetical protein
VLISTLPNGVTDVFGRLINHFKNAHQFAYVYTPEVLDHVGRDHWWSYHFGLTHPAEVIERLGMTNRFIDATRIAFHNGEPAILHAADVCADLYATQATMV